MPMHPFKRFSIAATAVAAALLLGSCGGGGGGGDPGGECPVTGCPPPDPIDIRSGVSATFDFDWDTGGDGSGGVGGGADGDGGVGAGGDFGQFRGAEVRAWRFVNGIRTPIPGVALTDNTNGMVTIRPGRTYNGPLEVELSGTATATYYEEGRKEFVPFPTGRRIRVIVPAVSRNVGATPFTEAAYRLLTEGSTGDRATDPQRPTQAQIRAANERVRGVLNQQFPSLLHVDDITRLPFIKSPAVEGQGSLRNNPRGRYGVVNGAFSKQAALFNGDRRTPTLDATRHLAEDLLDGQLDGRNQLNPAVGAADRTYDPNTLAGELSSALAEQAQRFGNAEILNTLPPVTSFGSVRYQGYLFDGSVSKAGEGKTTVAGWVGDNNLNRSVGQSGPPKGAGGNRAFTLLANMGHGGGFFKADTTNTADLGRRSRVFAIGDNVNGELGTGNQTDTAGQTVEVNLPGALIGVAGGFAHTVAVMADGAVYTWGDNSFGQLGLGQSASALPRSLTPQRVTLPLPALAVAATNVTSFALLNDGTVWAWGSSGGFGLLGDGSADSVSLVPVQVPGTDVVNIVQLVARDNDVLVLRRDNTVWQWGSHPADPSAFVPGDPSQPYLGGNRTPTQVAGLPAGLQVRKILTEQGLFVALLSNGHVYTWGVHFDITAGQILRDLTARRVLGLPPIRDMMPGGFVGYGVRAFDRLTSMGVDYRGGMWKIRGRVAEVFDPANPAAQRRPQNQGPRVDCEACHTPLDESLAEILARSQQPTTITPTTLECQPPVSVHQGLTASLIHAETDCVQCHNPSRLAYPSTTPSGNIPFASSGGWPNCVKPANLPSRSAIDPPLLTNSCQIPPEHPFTPPGTVCASCHNSIIARPLNQLATPCAQPLSSSLPTIATRTRIQNVVDDNGTVVEPGAAVADSTPTINGTIVGTLTAGQSVQLLVNGAPIGTASVSGSNWTFTGGRGDGSVVFTSRVVDAAGGFSANSNTYQIVIDTAAPSATASVTGFVDDSLGAIGQGGFATDTTPGIRGAVIGTLGAGESVRVFRNGTLIAVVSASNGTWNYTEPTPLALGTYNYQARIVDAAGNVGDLLNGASLTLISGVPSAAITQATNDGSTVIPSQSYTNDATPTLAGTLSAPLPTGHVLRLSRNGTSIGTAAVSGTNWTLTDPGAPDGANTYVARVEAGAVVGADSSVYVVRVDTQTPTQSTPVTQIADSFNGALPNNSTTADPTPTISGTLSAALAGNEQLRLLRNGSQVALLTFGGQSWSYVEPVVLAQGTYTYQAQVVDAAGNVGALGATQSVTINLTVPPLINASTTLATINGVAPSNGLVPPNNVVTPTLAGTIQRALNTGAGEVVRIYRNGAAIGTATVSGTSWSYTNTTLGDGSYTFAARIEVGANPTIFGQFSASIVDPIDATAPTQTANVTNIADNFNASLAEGATTPDSTPTISGTLNAALGAGESVRVVRNGTTAGTAIVTVNNTWSFGESAQPNGTYAYRAQVVDAAGNVSPLGATRTVTIDTSSIPLQNAATTLVTVNGVAPSGGAVPASNDRTPTLAGTIQRALGTGEIVRVYIDNVSQATAATVTGTSWSYAHPTNLADGTYLFRARIEQSGNAAIFGASTASISVPIDGTAPTQTASVTGASDDWNASLAPSGTTRDTTPVITGTLSAALAAGEQVRVLLNGTEVAPRVSTGSLSWSWTPTVPLANSTYSFTAQVVDAAGNLSAAQGAARALTVNTAAAALQGAATTLSTVNGVTPVGGAVPQSNDSTPTLAGTIARTIDGATERVRVYNGLNAIGVASVSGTTWSFTSAALPDGTYQLRAQIERIADAGIAGVSSATISTPIDATAPAQTATIATVYSDVQGLVDTTNTFSTDTTPRIDGTLSAALASGDFIRVLRNGVQVTTLRPAGLTWSYVEPAALATGQTYTYSVEMRDDAGNAGTAAATPARTVTLITQASLPAATMSNAFVSGTGSPNRPNGTVVAAGGGMPDSSPTLRVSLGAPLPAGYSVQLLRDGSVVATVPQATCPTTTCDITDPGPAAQGTRSYQARSIAGPMIGSTSFGYSLVIDTVAPAQGYSSLSATTSVMPNTTVNAQNGNPAASPNGNGVSNGALTNDNSPTLRIQLNAALASGETLRIRRNGFTVISSTLGSSCGINCYLVDLPSPVSLTNNEFGNPVSATVPSNVGLPTSRDFTVNVVDGAGFEGPTSVAYTVQFGYHLCDFSRADATHRLFNSNVAHSSWTGANCSSCHTSSSAAGPTPSGTLIRVPAGISVSPPSPSYWCRRP